MRNVHQMIVYYICKVISRISVGFDQDHIIQLRVRLRDISVNLVMESCLAFIRYIGTDNIWFPGSQICLNLFFGKMQTVFVIDTDFFSVDILF